MDRGNERAKIEDRKTKFFGLKDVTPGVFCKSGKHRTYA